jgi:hypothetical protein
MKTFYVFEMLSLCLSFSSSVFVPKRNSSFASFFFFFFNFNALTSTIRKRMEMKRVSELSFFFFFRRGPVHPQHMQGAAMKQSSLQQQRK